MATGSTSDLAVAAQALANEARAVMVLALLDGRAWTQTELARAGGVSASTASSHVDQLLDAGIVEELRQGRHRYVRIAGPRVAETIEALASLTEREQLPASSYRAQRVDRALREARSCYRHLAGRLGVALCDGVRAAGYVAPDWTLTVSGRDWLTRLGIDLPASTRRPLVRPCLDWTERREHLAGVAADALLSAALDQGWVTRIGSSRAVRLTPNGSDALRGVLGETNEARDLGRRVIA
jgi:DNA-binding transcriptional ArsR family regulator